MNEKSSCLWIRFWGSNLLLAMLGSGNGLALTERQANAWTNDNQVPRHQGPLLLTWINFSPSMAM